MSKDSTSTKQKEPFSFGIIVQGIESPHTVVEVFKSFGVNKKATNAQPAAVNLIGSYDRVDQLRANHTGEWMVVSRRFRKHGRPFCTS